MPSSISSSNERLPAGPWGAVLVFAFALVIVLLSGMEWALRRHGFPPGLSDSAALWAMERRAARERDPRQVVIIGASRIQLGIDLEVFAEEFPGPRPIQLAIDGSSPWPILQDLARQGSFKGVVICSAGFYDILDPEKWERPLEYLAFERKMTPADRAEQRLTMFLQDRLSLLLPDVNPGNAYRLLTRRKWPDTPYIETRADRSRQADFSLLPDLEKRRRSVERKILRRPRPKPVPAAELIAGFGLIEETVAAIQGRGGRVVFVRPPSTGFELAWEEKYYPRSDYWDVWREHTAAVMIHFQDHPALSGYDCPDYSHLDSRDAVPFTRALARIIRAKLEGEGRHFRETAGE